MIIQRSFGASLHQSATGPGWDLQWHGLFCKELAILGNPAVPSEAAGARAQGLLLAYDGGLRVLVDEK